MSSHDRTALVDMEHGDVCGSVEPTDLCARLEALASSGGETVPADTVQRLFTAAFRLFADQAVTGMVAEPFAPAGNVTATDVVVVASTMLRQQNLEVFELGLWQSFGGEPWTK